jgi:hypothetical protein
MYAFAVAPERNQRDSLLPLITCATANKLNKAGGRVRDPAWCFSAGLTPGRNPRTPQIPPITAPAAAPLPPCAAPAIVPIAAPAAAASRSRVPFVVRASILPSSLSPGFSRNHLERWRLPPRVADARGGGQYRRRSAIFLRARSAPRVRGG